MEHVLIDTSTYRADPRRVKPEFRALKRLARARAVQLHVPHYVKEEFLSQQRCGINKELEAIGAAARTLLRLGGNADLIRYAETTEASAARTAQQVWEWSGRQFQAWVEECHAIVHPVQPEHSLRVTNDYFSGSPPFRAPKHRDDLPDSFIWQTALDIVRAEGALSLVSADGGLYKAADENAQMEAYKTLHDFIQKDPCQAALENLTSEIVNHNVGRIAALLPGQQELLLQHLSGLIVNALYRRTVRHPAIADDNNEAMILMVGGPEHTEFDFSQIDYYGDGDLGIAFTTSVECTLSYYIYKGDYYTLPNTDDIDIEDWNDHYFSAEESYPLTAHGTLSITIDVQELESDQLTDEDLEPLIRNSGPSVEIDNVSVNVPDW